MKHYMPHRFCCLLSSTSTSTNVPRVHFQLNIILYCDNYYAIKQNSNVIVSKVKILLLLCSCGSVVEHCISSAKGCGFDSQGTHILTKKCIAWMHCKSLWIKASAKCINVNVISVFLNNELKNWRNCWFTLVFHELQKLFCELRHLEMAEHHPVIRTSKNVMCT